MNIVNILIYFVIGLMFGHFFIDIGYRLPINEYRTCIHCGTDLKLKNLIPVIGNIQNKCPYCKEKNYNLYYFFIVIVGVLYSFSYVVFKDYDPKFLNILFSLCFISSLLIITVSDFKYMLIPDEILITFGILLIILKNYLDYYNENITSFMDLGYNLIFIFFNFIIAYTMMLLIKKIGDKIFKKESMGKGDVKLMAYISVFIGYKLSIIVVFIASFIALPFSIYNMIRNNQNMLPFGPFLAIATIILFLCNINYDTVLNFIG